MQPLPIDDQIPAILQALKTDRRLILLAEPGAGKTTRVPPALATAGICHPDHPRVIVLQPRRVAAKAVAQRIADERGWKIGRQVGYHVRMERKYGPHTPLLLLTEGVLTRRLTADPLLEGIGAVILDEFHERSIHSDVALAMLTQIRQTVRPDLLLLVMSATLDPTAISAYLENAPVTRVPGRLYPVHIQYAAHADRPVEDRVAAAVQSVLADPPLVAGGEAWTAGHILVFLAGAGEIDRLMRRLTSTAREHNALLRPLHGSLPLEQQLIALAPSRQRKIILSTNIAETSITIEGVTVVVDSGLVRRAGFDPDRGIDRLELQRISRASADQRAGRAGRTAPGRCIRLWSAQENRHLAEFDVPEIQRLDLTPAVLGFYSWDRRGPEGINFLSAPPADRLRAAAEFLLDIEALAPQPDGGRIITPLGKQLLAIPIHPRLGNLILLAGKQGLMREASLLAALLSEKDILAGRAQHGAQTTGDSDILWRLDMLETGRSTAPRSRAVDSAAAYCDLDEIAVSRVKAVAAELHRLAAGAGEQIAAGAKQVAASPGPENRSAILRRLLLAAYPDRVCRRRAADPSRALMVGGRGVRMTGESIVRRPEFFLAIDVELSGNPRQIDATVRQASALDPQWLGELFPQSIRREEKLQWDAAARRVIATTEILYHDLPLETRMDVPKNPAAVQALLIEQIKNSAATWLLESERCAQILYRFAFLQRAFPEKAWPLPQIPDDNSPMAPDGVTQVPLTEVLAKWLAAQAAATGRVDQLLADESLADSLLASWDYAVQLQFDRLAPAAMRIPSGRNARLIYRAQGAPVLSAKLQELFGLRDTPRVADGRVPVTVEILGPNYRPVQTTGDLAGFWCGSYQLVRKDLRARYPKHDWPENPLTAVAKPLKSRA